jgi:hypothetical protein
MSLRLSPYTASDLADNPRLTEALQLLNGGDINGAIADLTSQAKEALAGSAFLLAAIYFQQSRFADVLTVTDRAQELAKHAGAQTVIGASNLKLDRPQAAFHALQKALNLDWQNHQAHRLAWTALIKLGLFSQAQKLAQAALEKRHLVTPPPEIANRIDLSNVTLCAVDCVSPATAARALQVSAHGCRFGAVKLLTSTRFTANGVETIPIGHLNSVEAYSVFIARDLHRHIDTEFALVTQWDGYVLNPQAWTPEFLKFDYVGARWTAEFLDPQASASGYDVGNGGFSLRSRRFLSTVARLAENLPAHKLHPEDAVLCRQMRHRLETEFTIRFATRGIADQFSFEHAITDQPTFGFHGVANLAATINDPAFCKFEFLNGMLDIQNKTNVISTP